MAKKSIAIVRGNGKLTYSQYVADVKIESKDREIISIIPNLPVGMGTTKPLVDENGELFVNRIRYTDNSGKTPVPKTFYTVDSHIVYNDGSLELPLYGVAPDELFWNLLKRPENRLKTYNFKVEMGKKRNFMQILIA